MLCLCTQVPTRTLTLQAGAEEGAGGLAGEAEGAEAVAVAEAAAGTTVAEAEGEAEVVEEEAGAIRWVLGSYWSPSAAVVGTKALTLAWPVARPCFPRHGRAQAEGAASTTSSSNNSTIPAGREAASQVRAGATGAAGGRVGGTVGKEGTRGGRQEGRDEGACRQPWRLRRA